MKCTSKIAAFIAIFLILNLLLCGFMPPDNGSSVDMWRRYHQKESVDIAVIGSSLASCALPEADLAAATGKTVSLMATNAQSWDMSQIALETLLQEHTPERVILVMDPSNMTCDPYPKAQKAFLYAELQTAEPKDIPAEFLHYVTSSGNFTGADSLNAFFPWQSGTWPDNWLEKIGQEATNVGELVSSRLKHRQDDGAESIIDFNTVGNQNTWNWVGHIFKQSDIDELTAMLQLCQQKGVPLLLITAPRTTLDVISYQTYFDDYAYFKQLCAQYGASYYDFNLAKPVLFESVEPDYFADYIHMSRAGGRAFSQSMAKFLEMLDAGQEVDSLFKTPDEYLAGVDYITNVYLTPEMHADENKILLFATSYQGPSVTPEYEFWAKSPRDTEYQKVLDYSDHTWIAYPLTERGTYQFRVNARAVGSDTDFDRYYEYSVDY